MNWDPRRRYPKLWNPHIWVPRLRESGLWGVLRRCQVRGCGEWTVGDVCPHCHNPTPLNGNGNGTEAQIRARGR